MSTSLVTHSLVRIAAGIATVLAVFQLFDMFAPRVDRAVAVGVAVGVAIAVSAYLEARLLRTPVSIRLLLLRAVAAGVVVALVLAYLQR